MLTHIHTPQSKMPMILQVILLYMCWQYSCLTLGALTYFPPSSLYGTKRLTMFENGLDNVITDMTVCQLSLQGKVWKKKEMGKSLGKNVETTLSMEQRSENS